MTGIKSFIVSMSATTILLVHSLSLGAADTSPFPPQLEMRVPLEPTAFPSRGHTYLVYELQLRNFTGKPMNLHRIDVFDAASAADKPIASFDDEKLDPLLLTVGPQNSAGIASRQIAGGGTAIAFMWVEIDPGMQMPKRLRHRVFTDTSEIDGADIQTESGALHVLGPPLTGGEWLASDGPNNDPDNHHRRGVIVIGGRLVISRRYAIDWMKEKDGALFSGNASDKLSFYSYGQPVLAVADATVVTARDGLPDNVPGHNEAFHPAVAITMDTVSGNSITLNLGSGQFAYYMHLQPGSVLVKAGDRVPRGQVVARVGNSGDARGPHLHFEVTTSPVILAGEGVPYLVDHYTVQSADNTWEARTHELPLGGTLVDFGQ